MAKASSVNKDDSQVFDMMTTATDETKVDLFSQDILNEIPLGTAVSRPEVRMTVGQRKAAKSFDAFIKRLGDSSESQIGKLREFWEAGGKPIIKIHKMGEEGGDGDKDRAYYRADGNPDMMGIFPEDLLNDFLAEISHGIKWNSHKGSKSEQEWDDMRSRISEKTRVERRQFGERRYGKTDSDTGAMTFPVMKETYFEIGERDGKEIVVDDKGNFYPDMKVPQRENRGKGSWGRVLGWGRTREENVKYDPKTRKGVGGETLTTEFEAHRVVQDSLRKVYDKLPTSKIKSEKEIREQYKRQMKKDIKKMYNQGDVFKYIKESEGSRI